MDLFKAQLERISRQLSGLSASQKMLTAALTAIMVMTLIWWGRYAAEPEMVPLFSYAMSADDVTQVLGVLGGAEIKATASGDSIMVPAAEKVRAYSLLVYSKALPRAGKDAYEDVIKNSNPFQSENNSDKQWARARDKTLGQLIGGFPGVDSADVIFAPVEVARIGHDVEPSASITMKTRPDAPVSKLVEAAASLVQGAQASMHRSNIRVVVNGSTVPVKDESDDRAVVELRDAAHAEETAIERKIRDYYHYMPGLLVSVKVAINTQRIEQKKTAFDSKSSMQKDKETHNLTEELTGPAAQQGESGAVPNTGLSVGAATASASGGGSTREQTDTKYENFPGMTETHTLSAPGETTTVGAAVQVPYDYIISSYKSFHRLTTEPSEAEVAKFLPQALEKVKTQVLTCTALKADAVAVDFYIDPTPPPAPVATAGGGVLSTSLISGGHIKEVVLGALALVSLFMVSTLVKKGAPAVAFAGPAMAGASGETPLISDIETAVGEVGASDPSLDGFEMDPEAIRTQQVAQQVTSLVKENPDSAAALVKRWMNRA